MLPKLPHVGLITSDLRSKHGWGSYSRSLVEALRDLGLRLTVLASKNTPQISGVDVLPILPNLHPRERFTLPRLLALRAWANDALRDCDVIHATVEPFTPLGAWIAGQRRLFVTGHGSYVRVGQAWRWPLSQVYASALHRSTLVCVSHYTARAAQAAVPGVKTVVVNNGVDARRFVDLPPLPEPKRGPTILSVGAIKKRKGTLELVRAMAEVRQYRPDVKCVIIGNLTLEPDYSARVQAEIAALGLQDTVALPGYVPDETLLAWYGAADLFVLPSMNAGWKFEGYGLSLIEASAAGLPVIGTRDCGAEDAVDDGDTGLLVSQANVATELPQAILSLLRDPERARRMGEAGQRKAQAQTWTQVARRMIDLYTKPL